MTYKSQIVSKDHHIHTAANEYQTLEMRQKSVWTVYGQHVSFNDTFMSTNADK